MGQQAAATNMSAIQVHWSCQEVHKRANKGRKEQDC